MEPRRLQARSAITIALLLAVGPLGACGTERPPRANGEHDPRSSSVPIAPPPTASAAPPIAAVAPAPSAALTAPSSVNAPVSSAPPPPAPICTTKIVAPPLGAQPRCERDNQCTLISSKCCFCGEIPRNELRAAHIEGRLSACVPATTCPACAAGVPEEITAACVDHVCRGVEKICK